MTYLDKLIDAVAIGNEAAAKVAARKLLADLAPNIGRAFNGSLDAAKALQDALLPERAAAEFRYIKRYAEESYVTVRMPDGYNPQGLAANPARAWLIAILKGYRTTQEAAQ